MDQLDLNMQDLQAVTQQVKNGIDDGEKCNIKGKVMLQRVTGQMSISFNQKMMVIQTLRAMYPA